MTSSTSLGSQLRHAAESLAREAGDMALLGRKSGPLSATTKSSPIDMVTKFDKASEAMITEGLAKLRPDDAIIGEEGAAKHGTSESHGTSTQSTEQRISFSTFQCGQFLLVQLMSMVRLLAPSMYRHSARCLAAPAQKVHPLTDRPSVFVTIMTSQMLLCAPATAT
jgi:hypothetical protein